METQLPELPSQWAMSPAGTLCRRRRRPVTAPVRWTLLFRSDAATCPAPAGGRRRAGQPRLLTGKPLHPAGDGVTLPPPGSRSPVLPGVGNAPLLEKLQQHAGGGYLRAIARQHSRLVPLTIPPHRRGSRRPAGGGSASHLSSRPLLHRGSAEEACAFYASRRRGHSAPGSTVRPYRRLHPANGPFSPCLVPAMSEADWQPL